MLCLCCFIKVVFTATVWRVPNSAPLLRGYFRSVGLRGLWRHSLLLPTAIHSNLFSEVLPKAYVSTYLHSVRRRRHRTVQFKCQQFEFKEIKSSQIIGYVHKKDAGRSVFWSLPIRICGMVT